MELRNAEISTRASTEKTPDHYPYLRNTGHVSCNMSKEPLNYYCGTEFTSLEITTVEIVNCRLRLRNLLWNRPLGFSISERSCPFPAIAFFTFKLKSVQKERLMTFFTRSLPPPRGFQNVTMLRRKILVVKNYDGIPPHPTIGSS